MFRLLDEFTDFVIDTIFRLFAILFICIYVIFRSRFNLKKMKQLLEIIGECVIATGEILEAVAEDERDKYEENE